MSTYMPKPGEVKPNWFVIDATDQIKYDRRLSRNNDIRYLERHGAQI